MIVSHRDKAVFREKTHEVLIAFDMLGDAVGDLYHGLRRLLRTDDPGAELVLSGGRGIVEFL